MHALMNIVVQGHVAYRSIDDVLSITSHSSNTTHNMFVIRCLLQLALLICQFVQRLAIAVNNDDKLGKHFVDKGRFRLTKKSKSN